jgi:hypothetical protein
MRMIVLTIMAVLAIAWCDGLTQIASADGIARQRAARPMPYRAECGLYKPCLPVGCPDRYSCYSLYGAYGPYGGPAYWSRYSFEGWAFRVR